MNEIKTDFTSRFQRSVRIDTDFDDESIVSSFVSSETANKTLIEVCNHINNGQSAFTWTGAYGSGKSSLAVILNGMLSHGNASIHKKSISLVSEDVQNSIFNTFNSFSSRTVLPLVAGRENLEIQLLKKLLKLHKSSQKFDNIFDLVSEITLTSQLVIYVDELGKYLEYANSKNEDIYFLQELAEKANRSKGSLIFIGILHQSFSEYSKSSDKEIRDEWAKIQGRFIDIPINVSVEEHLNLMAHALSYDKNKWIENDPHKSLLNFKEKLKKKYGWISKDNIDRLYPLNPVSALLISAISKRSFAQNQRTIFGFLNSVEPFGFKTVYLNNLNIQNFNYSPSDLWDYMYANLDTSIVNSSDSHNWITSYECINRAITLTNELSLKILKTISLIQLFGSRTILNNEVQNIYAAFPYEDCGIIDQTLDLLLKNKFILYREISKTFHISEASDFDLEATIKKYIENWDIPPTQDLQSLIHLKPIIGKRHYLETGNFRYMTISLLSLSELNNFVTKKHEYADGQIVICLPFNDEKRSSSIKIINDCVSNVNKPLAVALPKQSNIITQLIKKIWALQKIKEEEDILIIDKVARLEVSIKIDTCNLEFQELISNILIESDWTISQYNKKPSHKWSDKKNISIETINPYISSLFDQYYPDAPQIKNELTNRNKVSGNANQAIKIILNRCLTHENEEQLGITKTPPELTIYKSIIENFGFHKKIKNTYQFTEPDNQIKKLWVVTENLIKNSNDYTQAEDIYNTWTQPPFGIKRGVFPILLLMFILNKKSSLAVFHEGIFVTELDEIMIEWLLKNTNDFSFTIVNYDEVGEDLFNYHQILSKYLNIPINPLRGTQGENNGLTLEIGRNLKKILKNNPEWLKTTQLLSEKTIELRDEIKKANNPIDLCLSVLPKIFNRDMELFNNSLSELNNFYDKKIQSFKSRILTSFNKSDSIEDIKDLNQRSLNIMKKTGDHSLDPFVFQMSIFDGSKQSVENIILTLLKKDSRLINDHDLDQFNINLSIAVDSFKKVEVHTKISKRKFNVSSMSFVFGGANKRDPLSYDFKLSAKEKKEAKKIADDIKLTIEKNIKNFNQIGFVEDDKKPIIFGAVSKYLENLLDEENNET